MRAAADAISSPRVVAERVAALVRGRKPLLVVSDFDGTLAPIVMEPMAARILPAGRTALRRLARLAADRPDRLRVAVLSGRASSDVAARVRVGGVSYHGNHGLESGTLPRGRRAERLAVGSDPAFGSYVERATALGRSVAHRLGDPPWLLIEGKGPAVAFHFRQAPDTTLARTAVLEAIAAVEAEAGELGMVRFEGRRVVEVRPVGAGDKGTAVAALIERDRPGSVLVLGDDVSDADAFRAVVAARTAGVVDGLTVGVLGASETPDAILDAADLVLPAPAAAARFLGRVASALERELAEPARPGSGPSG